MTYEEFLKNKRAAIPSVGFDVPESELCAELFPWQKAIVRWALKRGRAALFEDCGLGKTPQQLEWARQIVKRTGGRVLILTPLAVAAQTVREGFKFGIPVEQSRDGTFTESIVIVNYERLHYFRPEDFKAIILDESSILKAFDGKTRKELTEFSRDIMYRLCCTATPAPNDLIELTNHSEFLGIMSGKEIIALFFKQDGNTTHAWRLKGHAVEPFYEWLAEWSVAIRKPSDIGYEDDGFRLPELHIENVQVEGSVLPGELFASEAQTLLERRQARRATLGDRVGIAATVANGTREQVLVWCDLNAESDALTRAIPDAVEIRGSHDAEYKEAAILGFVDGKTRVIISKPTITGYGLNLQNCATMIFVGLSDSYEQFYQAVRRCWRFGQKREVRAYIVTADTEGAVVKNIRRKEKQAQELFDGLVAKMRIYEEVNMSEKKEMEYQEDVAEGKGWRLLLGDSVKRIKEIADESVGLSIFSPPFPGMYAYTNSAHDIGNSTTIDQMMEHFGYMMPDLLRITMPGRNCCIHLTQIPAFQGKDGYIGIMDFRGRVIMAMEKAGWRFFGEVTIDKNPQVKAVRTKERGLLFKSLATDASVMRMALADYLLQFRKDGNNPVPIRAGISEKYGNPDGWITADEWIEWAAPVWYRQMKDDDEDSILPNYPGRKMTTDGIKETDVLPARVAREEDDEKHLCPLQLGVIERAVKLWSAPGDLVFSPFAGIGSEGYQAIRYGRQFVGIELKRSYFDCAVRNLQEAKNTLRANELFSTEASA